MRTSARQCTVVVDNDAPVAAAIARYGSNQCLGIHPLSAADARADNRTQVYDLIQNAPPPGRLRLTANVDFVIGTNVDTPSGQTRGQTSVLPFLADRQR